MKYYQKDLQRTATQKYSYSANVYVITNHTGAFLTEANLDEIISL